MAEILGGKPNRFLTLTVRPIPNETPEAAIKRLNAAWRELRRRICRDQRLKTLPHMTIVERHVSGMPHLHIFLRCPYLKFHWLSQQMEVIADAPHVFIQYLYSKTKAAAYAAKYCTKADQQIGNAKRYYKARCYEQRPITKKQAQDLKDGSYERLQTPIETLAARLIRDGWDLQWPDADTFHARPPPKQYSWPDRQQRKAERSISAQAVSA